MANREIEAIELEIRNAQKILDTAATLDRLNKNVDFKKIVMEGYFKEEAIRLVHLKSQQHMSSPESQSMILNQIDAIGCLSSYMDATYHKAAMAHKVVEDGPDMIEACYLDQEESA